MSRTPSPWTPQQKINRMTPAAADVGLGDTVEEIITKFNALQASFQSLLAHLDTANVTGIGNQNAANYGNSLVAVTDLNSK